MPKDSSLSVVYVEAFTEVEEIEKRTTDPKEVAIRAYLQGHAAGFNRGSEYVLTQLEAGDA